MGRRRSQHASGLLSLGEDGIRLGTRLRASIGDSDRLLLFTSAAEGDGVTSVAAQAALSLARLNEGEVLLIDANLRRPRLHELFGARRIPGLFDVIGGSATIDTAVRPSEHASLSYLTAGAPDLDPVSLFTAPGFPKLMQELRGLFRFILVDSSPLLKFADTALIAPRADGVVLVVAAGRRRREEVREMIQNVAGLRIKLLGVVLFERPSGLFGSRLRSPV